MIDLRRDSLSFQLDTDFLGMSLKGDVDDGWPSSIFEIGQDLVDFIGSIFGRFDKERQAIKYNVGSKDEDATGRAE